MEERNEKGQFIKGYYTGHGFKKGLIPWNKGLKLGPESLETRKKKSLAKKGIPISEERRIKRLGKGNPNWRGGVHRSRGYIYDYYPDHPNVDVHGYVARHRLIAERALGRYLKNNEVVHHINGDNSDNHNDNLIVCTRNYHAWLHIKLDGRRNQDGTFAES